MSFALALLALFGVALWLSGSCAQSCSEAYRGEIFDADAWVAAHGSEAEAYARRLLAGEEGAAVPSALAPYRPRRLGETVVFTVIRGGFTQLDKGVCFSASGRPPPHAFSGEPRESPLPRWESVKGPWWYWETDLF